MGARQGLLWGLTHWANRHGWKNWVQAAGGAAVCRQHRPAWAREGFPALPLPMSQARRTPCQTVPPVSACSYGSWIFVCLLTPRALMWGSTRAA